MSRVTTEATTVVGECREITVPEEASQAVGLRPGDTVRVRVTGPKTLEVTILPRTIQDWWAQYPIEGPLDYERVRREAEEELADELIRRIEDGIE
jgi:hypothetical protein